MTDGGDEGGDWRGPAAGLTIDRKPCLLSGCSITSNYHHCDRMKKGTHVGEEYSQQARPCNPI